MSMKRARCEAERQIVTAFLESMPRRCPADMPAAVMRDLGAAYQHAGLPEEALRWIGWAEAREARWE